MPGSFLRSRHRLELVGAIRRVQIASLAFLFLLVPEVSLFACRGTGVAHWVSLLVTRGENPARKMAPESLLTLVVQTT